MEFVLTCDAFDVHTYIENTDYKLKINEFKRPGDAVFDECDGPTCVLVFNAVRRDCL